MSIRTKMLVAVTLATTLLIVGVASVLVTSFERTTRDHIGEAQFALASLVAQDIDDKLASAQEQLVALATTIPPTVLADSDAADRLLREHQRLYAFFTGGLYLFDAHGSMFAEAPSYGRRGTDFRYRDYMAETLATRAPHISAPYRSTRPGAPPSVIMTAPVFDRRGELVAVLGGAINLLEDSVLGRTVRMRCGTSGYYFVFDRDRTMILHPDASRILRRDIPAGANSLLDRAIGGLDGSGETVNSRGVRVLASFKHLRNTNWIVGVNVPVVEAYAPIARARRTLWLALAVVIPVLTALLWCITAHLMAPLIAFTGHVRSMPAKRGADRAVLVPSGDEIGDLAEAFNGMIAELDAQQLEIRRAARSWHATFDSFGDGACVLDGELRVVHANRALRELAGDASRALTGTPVDELLVRVLEDASAAGAADLGAGRGRALRRVGERWLELRRDVVEGSGGGYVQIVADVTREQELRDRLHQSQKLEAIGLLAGGVAHDFNNILCVVLTFAASLHDELPDGELRSFAREIWLAGDRGATLTRQLLAFGRRQVLRPETLLVREVVEQVTTMIRRLIGEHIALTVDVGRATAAVRMDRSQLEQVLVNLAVNARDAMPRGGRLAVVARDLDELAGSGDARAWVEISVADTGEGIDPEIVGRIFEPFFSTKGVGKGTGLGLAIVHAAVQQAGGTVDVRSAPGAGTSFTVRLPRAPQEPAAARALPERTDHGRGERVLVVEDEPMVRASLERLLAGNGYEVAAATNGEEALTWLRAAPRAFDLVVTDVVMPRMGGFALARAARDFTSVPFLYMTGYSEEVVSGREHVAPELLLEKPFERDVVLQRIRVVLERAGADRAA